MYNEGCFTLIIPHFVLIISKLNPDLSDECRHSMMAHTNIKLSYSKGTKVQQNQNSQYPGKHHRECQGVSKTKVGMPWC